MASPFTNQPIHIDDDNWEQHVLNPYINNQNKGRGLELRPAIYPYGSHPYATTTFASLGITPFPRSEWSERIREQREKGLRVSDVRNRHKLKSLDQASTNFCWANAPVNLVRLNRAASNSPDVDLSPASVACPINGFVNQGGWGGEALKGIIERGVNKVQVWPANAISRQYDTAEARADAATRRVTEWTELEPGNFDQVATMLLMGYAIAVGLNWWRHEVTYLDLVEPTPGQFGVLFWNSWADDYGVNGTGTMSESKARPDDAVVSFVSHATAES